MSKSVAECGGYEAVHRREIINIILKQDRITYFVQNVNSYSMSQTLLEQDPVNVLLCNAHSYDSH